MSEETGTSTWVIWVIYGKQMGQGRTFFINFCGTVGFTYLAQDFLKPSFKMKMNLRGGFVAHIFYTFTFDG